MAPSETTRPFFYFSTHNHARPTRIKPAGEHMVAPNVREYQGQHSPGARVVARAAPAIFRFLDNTHRKKLKNGPSGLATSTTATPIPLLFWCVAKGIGARPSRASTMFLCAAWRKMTSIDEKLAKSNTHARQAAHKNIVEAREGRAPMPLATINIRLQLSSEHVRASEKEAQGII